MFGPGEECALLGGASILYGSHSPPVTSTHHMRDDALMRRAHVGRKKQPASQTVCVCVYFAIMMDTNRVYSVFGNLE